MAKRKAPHPSKIFLALIVIAAITAAAFFVWKNSESKASSPPGPVRQSALNYTALGDSLTEGASPDSGFVPLYGSYVKQDINTNVNITNVGKYGLTSNLLLNKIKTDDNFKNAIRKADLITIEIGLNDLGLAKTWYQSGICGGSDSLDCFRTITGNFPSYFEQIITETKALNSYAEIRVMDVYYMTVNEDKSAGNFDKFKPFLDKINDAITDKTSIYNIPVARVHETFNGPNGDQDGYDNGYLYSPSNGHPNETGISLISQKFRDIGYQKLDLDNDLYADVTENCPGVSNPDQANYNSEPFDLPDNLVTYNDNSNPIADKVGNACDTDMDHDYLDNTQETKYGTNALNPDSDNDTNLDGVEVRCSTNPTSAQSFTNSIVIRNTSSDTDNDGLSNTCEDAFGTNPFTPDSDGDGANDRVEVLFWGTNGTATDSDGDSCRDDIEMADINGDRKVTSIDNSQLSQKFGATIGSTNYMRSFDMNGDGKISSIDLSFISQRSGLNCPTPPPPAST